MRLCTLCILTLLFHAATSLASTDAGGLRERIRAPLDAPDFHTNDITEFVLDFTASSQHRMTTLLGVDRVGNTAVVRYLSTDAAGVVTEHSLQFHRDPLGVWQYHAPGQPPVDVYTYVPKRTYYWEKSWKRVGLVLGGLTIMVPSIWLFVRRPRQHRAHADTHLRP